MERHSSALVVLKKLIFSPLVIAAILFSSQESKAEGGCPNGFAPIGGGYCRNVVCKSIYNAVPDRDLQLKLSKYNWKCDGVSFLHWGDQVIPKK